MRRMWMFLLPLAVSACQAQTNTPEGNNKNELTPDNQPKTEVKVYKEYDDNGNLIRYDSTYVWSYTNTTGDSTYVNIDTLMSEFRPFMQHRFPEFFANFENNWLEPDSVLYHNFLGPDYFTDRWKSELNRMDHLFEEMDSLRQLFLQEHYPGLILNPEEKK